MKYIDADLLRAEIGRKNLANYCGTAEQYEEELLALLDSIPEKPVEGLEAEIDACWQNWLSPSNQKEVEGVLPKTEFTTYARHFYELGQQSRPRKEASKRTPIPSIMK